MNGNVGSMNVLRRGLDHLRVGIYINRRKKHILKNEKHLKSLQELHSKYVLVPADKASGNVIIVCKKHYLEVVSEEVNATTTYEHFA